MCNFCTASLSIFIFSVLYFLWSGWSAFAVSPSRLSLSLSLLFKATDKYSPHQSSKGKDSPILKESIGFRSWSRSSAVSSQVTEPTNQVVGCHYFPPGQRLPPQPPSIIGHWPVPNYTAWWQRHMCVLFVRQFCPCEFFNGISQSNNCLHNLLPPLRDTQLIMRLRYANTYPVPFTKTKRFRLFINLPLRIIYTSLFTIEMVAQFI